MSLKKFQVPDTLRGNESNILTRTSALVKSTASLDLASGNPGFSCPSFMKEFLCKAAKNENDMLHQYTRMSGHPKLVHALADLYSPMMGRSIDALNDLVVTCGGLGALHSIIHAFINPGDEVILIEPFYIRYTPIIQGAGGVPVYVPLRNAHTSGSGRQKSFEWTLDSNELAGKFSNKTKLIIVNNPTNPLGKVYTKGELEEIGELCKKHDVVCIADEVFEWQNFTDRKHIHIASLPGMWERTLTVGSAGKSFLAFGWKTGWCMGPVTLVSVVNVAHTNTQGVCHTLLQEAAADAIKLELSRLYQPSSYFVVSSRKLKDNRDKLVSVLEGIGLQPIVPDGGIFMMVDVSNVVHRIKLARPSDERSADVVFAEWMCKEKQVGSVPCSAFFSSQNKHLGAKFVRFSLDKDDQTIDSVVEIFRKWSWSASD